MAAGMWQGLLAGYKDAEEKKAAREEKEEALMAKRRTIAQRLRPTVQANLQMVQEQKSMLTYLKDKGLATDTINALYQDPETLQGAFEFVRAGKGADLSPEKLNDIFKVTPLGTEAPGDAFAALQSSASVYESFDSVEDPETFFEMMPTPPAMTAIVESRLPEEPKEQGVTSMQDRTWGIQAKAYDTAVITLARGELEVLDSKADKSEADIDRATTLREDIAKYGSDPATAERVRAKYGDTALEFIASSDNIAPEVKVGLNSNPLILNIGEEARQSVLDNLGPEFKGGVLTHEGVDDADGRFTKFYRMPDGTIEIVKE